MVLRFSHLLWLSAWLLSWDRFVKAWRLSDHHYHSLWLALLGFFSSVFRTNNKPPRSLWGDVGSFVYRICACSCLLLLMQRHPTWLHTHTGICLWDSFCHHATGHIFPKYTKRWGMWEGRRPSQATPAPPSPRILVVFSGKATNGQRKRWWCFPFKCLYCKCHIAWI